MDSCLFSRLCSFLSSSLTPRNTSTLEVVVAGWFMSLSVFLEYFRVQLGYLPHRDEDRNSRMESRCLLLEKNVMNMMLNGQGPGRLGLAGYGLPYELFAAPLTQPVARSRQPQGIRRAVR